ncbi:MAG: hypothetical protein JOS17DRAFT_496307 [Linnemannia elongata]|nr:MAG: hypothetical protein JOS17DRAFT_496307 [Linnemannia elongata]
MYANHGIVDSHALLLNPFIPLVFCFLPAPAKTCTYMYIGLALLFTSTSSLSSLPPLPPRSFLLSLLIALPLSLLPLPEGTKKAYLTQKGQQSNGKKNITLEGSKADKERELSTFFCGKKNKV